MGGASIYCKFWLPVRVLNISLLHEYINCKLEIQDNLCGLIYLHRSPSQNTDEFERFTSNFKLNLEYISNKNLYFTIVLGDFAKS